ncbi:MAG: hypothetical protein NT159_08910 [Proteobacteria bacterium]|nr:hypothetical protein [Pseudomonadota bacterium]
MAEHLMTVVAMPAQTGSVELPEQVDTKRATQPTSAGLVEHCAIVTDVTAQMPGLAAHNAAHPERDGLVAHWAMVVVPELPMQMGSVGLVGQVAMICVHSGMVGVDWQTA